MLKVLNQQKQMFTTTQVACWKHHVQISKHDGALYLSEYLSENNTLFLVLKTLKKNPYSCSGLSKSKYVCKKEMEQFAQQQYYYFDLKKKCGIVRAVLNNL